MAELQYDFFGKMEGSGFCLKRFELFNWGTFHDKIWIFTPNSHNSLVTGDIGSGKSSLVDAITTLIVPNRRIVYNKAAGATRQERDIFTYIRGAYKTESGNDGNEEKKKYLRKSGAFSVILGVFESAESWQTITLAQAFRYRQDSSNNNNGRGSLQKIFVIAEQELNIAEHFLTGEGDLKILKRWLRQQSKIEVFEVFKEYCTRFRRLLGLRNEQALDLFYQTVSMKSVGNRVGAKSHQVTEGVSRCPISGMLPGRSRIRCGYRETYPAIRSGSSVFPRNVREVANPSGPATSRACSRVEVPAADAERCPRRPKGNRWITSRSRKLVGRGESVRRSA